MSLSAFQSKSLDWFLYNRDLRHDVKWLSSKTFKNYHYSSFFFKRQCVAGIIYDI